MTTEEHLEYQLKNTATLNQSLVSYFNLFPYSTLKFIIKSSCSDLENKVMATTDCACDQHRTSPRTLRGSGSGAEDATSTLPLSNPRHGGSPADAQLAVLGAHQGTCHFPHLSTISSCHQDHYDPQQTYQDPNRAYHDVVNALGQYPSLSPRTDVYSGLYPMHATLAI